MNTCDIAVTVNGQHRHIPAQGSIVTLLQYLEIPVDRVAVELNKVLVRKRDWTSTRIVNGAHLEIVEFVGGG